MPSPRTLLTSFLGASLALLGLALSVAGWHWTDQQRLAALPTLLPSRTAAAQSGAVVIPTTTPAPTVPPPTAPPPPATATVAPPSASVAQAPTAMPTLPGGAVLAVVAPDGRGLRLRAAPNGNATILANLMPGDVLTVTGRTSDSVWLQVTTARPEAGWVMSRWVTLPVLVENLPVPGAAGATGALVLPTYVILPTPKRLTALWAAAREQGRDLRAFAVIGDSNSWKADFLKPLATPGAYHLGDYAPVLQGAVDYWGAALGRESVAAQIGFNTLKVQQAENLNNRAECQAGETPVICELRVTRASVALILLGTNDQYEYFEFESRARAITEYCLGQGVLPVWVTKADANEAGLAPDPDYLNAVMRRLAKEYDLPLLDARLLTDTLPNHGLEPDGYHLNGPLDGQAATFDADHLQFGYPARNLAVLWALWALWQSQP